MRAVKFLLMVAASLAILTAPADAQRRGKGKRDADQQTVQQKKKAAETEKAYEATLKQMPDQKFDPWAKMR